MIFGRCDEVWVVKGSLGTGENNFTPQGPKVAEPRRCTGSFGFFLYGGDALIGCTALDQFEAAIIEQNPQALSTLLGAAQARRQAFEQVRGKDQGDAPAVPPSKP